MPTKAEKLKQRLARVNPAILEHFFLYYPASPSGLLWKEAPAACAKPGDIAGTYCASGYWEVLISGFRYKCHHIVLLLNDVLPGPEDTEADHIDRNKSNNTIGNLRWTTRSENCRNKKVLGASPYKYATKYKNKWMAKWRFPNQGKYMFSGYFECDYEAHCAAVSHRNQELGTNELPQARV